MNSSNALVVVALAASILLLLTRQARVPAIIAVVASTLQVLIAFRIISLQIAGLPLGLLLGATLLVAGVLVYLKVATKPAVTAAAITVLVGAIQVLRGLRLF